MYIMFCKYVKINIRVIGLLKRVYFTVNSAEIVIYFKNINIQSFC